jgi:hypothetical protein
MTEGSQAGQPESRGSPEPVSYEAEAEEVAKIFRIKLDGLRRRLRPSEIPAAVRALREEKQAALRALRDRRASERHSEKELRRQMRPPPQPEPK